MGQRLFVNGRLQFHLLLLLIPLLQLILALLLLILERQQQITTIASCFMAVMTLVLEMFLPLTGKVILVLFVMTDGVLMRQQLFANNLGSTLEVLGLNQLGDQFRAPLPWMK